MPNKISKQNEDVVEKETEEGDIDEGDSDIDTITIEFDRDDFSALDKYESGDKVVVVLSGFVTEEDEESVMVEFGRASVIHGKMMAAHGKGCDMEDELSDKKPIGKKYSLAKHIALRRKK